MVNIHRHKFPEGKNMLVLYFRFIGGGYIDHKEHHEFKAGWPVDRYSSFS